MNFIKAIQHATIGYDVRRVEWPVSRFSLTIKEGDFYDSKGNRYSILRDLSATSPSKHLLKPEDITASDWKRALY